MRPSPGAEGPNASLHAIPRTLPIRCLSWKWSRIELNRQRSGACFFLDPEVERFILPQAGDFGGGISTPSRWPGKRLRRTDEAARLGCWNRDQGVALWPLPANACSEYDNLIG